MATDITPADIIKSQQDYVSSFIFDGQQFIDSVANLATTTFDVGVLNPLEYSWDTAVQRFIDSAAALTPDRPGLGVSFTTKDLPAAPVIPDIAIDSVEVADFASSAPTLDIPQAPSASLPSAPSAPAFVDPLLPDAPIISLPATPTFDAITLPEPPSIQIPSFNSTLPLDTLTSPSNVFSFYEQAYQSALLDSVKAKLLDNLENGGYGIEPADEQALWERERDRELNGVSSNLAEVWRTGAARGFPLPPGDLYVAVEQAQQQLIDKMSSVSRDIGLKRADLYVANRQFTIQESRQLEQVLINYHTSLMERALNASKAVLDAEISVFNAQVARYNAQLEAYKTEAQVFEARIRAALSQSEIYRTNMDGKRIELDIQRTEVDLYRAQLAGVETVVNIYRTRTDAANIQANIQRTKLEAFRAQIDAFAQTVQAKVAEFGMYEARIRGETAKVTAFESEVRAYTSQVEAAKVRADIQVANARATLENSQTKLAVYNGELTRYRTVADIDIALDRLGIDRYSADITAYNAKLGALEASYKLQLEDVKRQDIINIESLKANTDIARLQLQQLVSATEIRLSASTFGADFYRTIVASSLNSINALAVQTQSV